MVVLLYLPACQGLLSEPGYSSALERANGFNDNILGGAGLSIHRGLANGVQHIKSGTYLAEDRMFACQPFGIGKIDEELGTIGVGAAVGHCNHTTHGSV